MRIPAHGVGFHRKPPLLFLDAVRCANPTVNNLPFDDYGCSCIFRGTDNQPVDEFDRCCQVHNECYTELKKMECFRPMIRYFVHCENEIPKCVPRRIYYYWVVCGEKLWNCDVEAGLCFRKHYHSYNKEFLQYDQALCKILP